MPFDAPAPVAGSLLAREMSAESGAAAAVEPGDREMGSSEEQALSFEVMVAQTTAELVDAPRLAVQTAGLRGSPEEGILPEEVTLPEEGAMPEGTVTQADPSPSTLLDVISENEVLPIGTRDLPGPSSSVETAHGVKRGRSLGNSPRAGAPSEGESTLPRRGAAVFTETGAPPTRATDLPAAAHRVSAPPGQRGDPVATERRAWARGLAESLRPHFAPKGRSPVQPELKPPSEGSDVVTRAVGLPIPENQSPISPASVLSRPTPKQGLPASSVAVASTQVARNPIEAILNTTLNLAEVPGAQVEASFEGAEESTVKRTPAPQAAASRSHTGGEFGDPLPHKSRFAVVEPPALTGQAKEPAPLSLGPLDPGSSKIEPPILVRPHPDLEMPSNNAKPVGGRARVSEEGPREERDAGSHRSSGAPGTAPDSSSAKGRPVSMDHPRKRVSPGVTQEGSAEGGPVSPDSAPTVEVGSVRPTPNTRAGDSPVPVAFSEVQAAQLPVPDAGPAPMTEASSIQDRVANIAKLQEQSANVQSRANSLSLRIQDPSTGEEAHVRLRIRGTDLTADIGVASKGHATRLEADLVDLRRTLRAQGFEPGLLKVSGPEGVTEGGRSSRHEGSSDETTQEQKQRGHDRGGESEPRKTPDSEVLSFALDHPILQDGGED